MYLLDTPVISELRKARSGRADPGVVTWASGIASHNLYISVLSLLELENGVAAAEKKDPASGAPLRDWLDNQVMTAFDNRVLPIDSAVAKKRAALPASGNERDALLAATALAHGATLVTRNTSAYRHGRVKLFNPWGYSPETDTVDDGDWQQVARSGPMWLKNLFLRF